MNRYYKRHYNRGAYLSHVKRIKADKGTVIVRTEVDNKGKIIWWDLTYWYKNERK